MKTIAFFNNKGGVGKTSMVYHLSWMLREMGHRTLAVDLDPQSNLTSAFLEEEKLESLWPKGPHPSTILGAIQPLIDSMGDIAEPFPIPIESGLNLIAGDLGLSMFEDRLSEAWRKCLDDNPASAGDGFRVISAFYRVIARAAQSTKADFALIDVGPNVGALNRAALVASDYVVIPLGADLFSLQGLRNLGPTLRQWRSGWENRRHRDDTIPTNLTLPTGSMAPVGYVLLNPSVRENKPVKAYLKWAQRIPQVYASEVVGSPSTEVRFEDDPHILAMIKHFKSLMPMAQERQKPMFLLTPADGAIGGHSAAVKSCYDQFKALAVRILGACNPSSLFDVYAPQPS